MPKVKKNGINFYFFLIYPFKLNKLYFLKELMSISCGEHEILKYLRESSFHIDKSKLISINQSLNIRTISKIVIK
ncbi:uncharacterized protein METZ01_LOCUS275132 [marine metagenome]|uniref:Uncharacterized protein n=1 Tax=marine metagenome TaxID=408172 RepID=A0A382KD45_9ZZZZ